MIIDVFCIKKKYRKLKEYFSRKENQLEYIKSCNDMDSLNNSASNCRSSGTTSTIGYNSKLFDSDLVSTHVILNGDSGTVCFGYGLDNDKTQSGQIDEYYDSNGNMISAVFYRDNKKKKYINKNKRLDFSDKTHSNNLRANNFAKKHIKYIRRKT